jgi:nicotinamidase-related amidase
MAKEKYNKYKILVVVDMQNDFITGSLPAEGGQQIVPRVVEKIKDPKYYKVILTRDTHFEDYLYNTEEGRILPIKHCIDKTEGWELIDEIKELVNNVSKYLIIDKTTPGSTLIYNWLYNNKNNIESVEFVGVCTDICVLSNVVMAKSALTNSRVIVDASACAGSTKDNHEKALDLMQDSLMCKVENR